MQLVPVGKRILVKFQAPEKKGVILMTKQEGELIKCEVIGVGDKVEIKIEEGNKLLLCPYSGSKVAGSEEEPYMIINEADVIGILK